MGCSESKESNTVSVQAAKEKLFESRGKILSSSSSALSSASSGMGSSASTNSDKSSNPSSATGKDTQSPSTSSGIGSAVDRSSVPTTGYSGDEDLDEDYLKEGRDQMNDLPFSLDAIPNSDLGESLDARKMKTLLPKHGLINGSTNASPFPLKSNNYDVIQCMSASGSAKSVDSTDSGVYELDDVITENSTPDLVQRVEMEFTPVENIDLTITGKACPRLLSGSQRVRQQEQEVLESLRQEGFIATSRMKSTGGMAFEVVEDNPEVVESAGGKIKPKNFLPRKHKEHLDKQINKFHLRDLTSADVERRHFLASERRKSMRVPCKSMWCNPVLEDRFPMLVETRLELIHRGAIHHLCRKSIPGATDALEIDAKIERVANVTHQSNIEKKIEDLKKKKTEKADAALEKREAHLKELRDKLKAQNKKANQIKLKKLINDPPMPVPFGANQKLATDNDRFFDN